MHDGCVAEHKDSSIL